VGRRTCPRPNWKSNWIYMWQNVSAYKYGLSEPKLATLLMLCNLLGVGVEEFLSHDIESRGRMALQPRNLQVLTIAADDSNRENITWVNQKASAGYLNGFADTEYMETLPQFHLTNLSRQATYRAFELAGDSMLPLISGTIVIGTYVDQLQEIKSGRTYVLVTQTEGVVYKRVFNYLAENGKLFLVSDNEVYKLSRCVPRTYWKCGRPKPLSVRTFPTLGTKRSL